MSPPAAIRDWTRRWIRRRQGPDPAAVNLHRGRIYILPTGLGIAFSVMLFAMLLGSLNYANNLGLALTFLLAALGLVAMHACHRNLAGLVVTGAGTEPPYAGQAAGFRLNLSNPSKVRRIDIETGSQAGGAESVTVPAAADAIVRQETAESGLDRDIWQMPVVFLADVRSVGVQGDGRTYGHPVVLRPVTSEDAMTADWARLPYELLERISTRITNEVPEINRVILDVTSKPPGTIEWE